MANREEVKVPRGVEVLVKKAAVDEEFRKLLLAQRGDAAAAIGLELDPVERAMLSTIPEGQLGRIIGQTVVPTEQRRVFLGKVAAAMLAALGVGLATSEGSEAVGGAAVAAPGAASGSVYVGVGGIGGGVAGTPRASQPPQTSTKPAPTTETAPAATSVGRFYGSGASGGAGPGRVLQPATPAPAPGGGQYELPPQPATQPASGAGPGVP